MKKHQHKDPKRSSIILDSKSRQALIKMVIRLFDQWNLKQSDQMVLLGLSPNSHSMLRRYRTGVSAPASPDKINRISYILLIHKSLKTLYPKNDNLCYTWIHQKNSMLGNVSPLNIMRDEGIVGMFKIAEFLKNILNR